MKPQMKYVVIGLAVMVVLVVLTFANPMSSRVWRSIYPPASKVRTDSNEQVDITLRDDRGRTGLQLAIPKAYLVDADNWRGGSQEVVSIETQLPDLLPASALPKTQGKPGTTEYETSMAQFRNGIAITLFASRANTAAGVQPHREEIVKANQLRTDSTKYELISSDYHGLEGYRQLKCSRSAFPGSVFNDEEYCVDNLSEHYLPATSQSATVYFICMRATDEHFDARMGCRAYSQFAGHQLNYGFRRSELPRWREFHDGVQQLLTRFQKPTN